MRQRRFASWVAPTAAVLAQDRRQVIAFAHAAPHVFWDRPSVVPGWTNKEILAHLAGGNDLVLQRFLRAAAARAPLDASLLQLDTDEENARGVAERRVWPVERLIAELERDGDEVQWLLSHVREEDRELGRKELPIDLAGFLHSVEEERHDRLHLDQLQAGLQAGAQ